MLTIINYLFIGILKSYFELFFNHLQVDLTFNTENSDKSKNKKTHEGELMMLFSH